MATICQPRITIPRDLSSVGRPPKSTCSDRAQPTPNARKPQASLGGWAPRAPGTGGGGPRGPGAPFQRPENGNCAKRISKSGRAQSPPAYIKPQEPARPPAASPPGGEQSAGPWPGRPGVGTTTDPLTKGLAFPGRRRGSRPLPTGCPEKHLTGL